jgi:tetratricopeptide (TPR) repeat protein
MAERSATHRSDHCRSRSGTHRTRRKSVLSKRRSIVVLGCWFLVLGCGNSELSLDEIRALQAREAWQETIEPLRARIDNGERDPELLVLYGTALSKVGKHSQAHWPLRDAARDPEWFTRAMMQLASGAYVTGNHDLAIERLSEVLEREPEHLRALKMRCMARLQSRRDYEGALEDAERVIDLDPETTEMTPPRIVALLGLDRIEEARETIEAFAGEEIIPEGEESETPVGMRALACVGWAKFNEEDGNAEVAAEQYSLCAEAFPSQAIAIVEAMEFYRDRGDQERFDSILKAAYDAAPQNREFRISYARRQQLLGNEEEAHRVLEAGSKAGYPGAMLDFAGYLVDSGDLDAGINVYRDAKSQGASGPSFLLSFGEALISAGLYDEALAVADETGPESHKTFIRGRVALEQRDYVLALDSFTRGVLLWPDNAVARYYTALAAEQVGDFDRAIEEYRNAMRIDASAADTRLRLATLHLAEGNPQAALYILRYQGHGDDPIRGNFDLILSELEGMGQIGRYDQLPPPLIARISFPGVWGRAVAALAKGVGRRQGAKAASEVIQSADRLDLESLSAAPALRSLVVNLSEVGEGEAAIEAAHAAAVANPDNALMQTILAEALLLAGQPDAADEAFGRALAIDADREDALIGQGLAALADGRPSDAMESFARVSNEATTAEMSRARAQILATTSRLDEAIDELTRSLERDPLNGETALELVKRRLERGDSHESIQSLVQRSIRFGGGDEAREFLTEVAQAKAD